jgi:hypothetical protein
MPQTSEANGTLVFDGVVVLERYSLRFHDEGSRLAHSQDPERSFREIIEKSGKKINKLHVLSQAQAETLRQTVPMLMPEGLSRQQHFVYPASDASAWICCCA